MRRTNSSPDVNTLWVDSVSTDSESTKRASLFYESSESEKDSFTLSGEIEQEPFQSKIICCILEMIIRNPNFNIMKFLCMIMSQCEYYF